MYEKEIRVVHRFVCDHRDYFEGKQPFKNWVDFVWNPEVEFDLLEEEYLTISALFPVLDYFEVAGLATYSVMKERCILHKVVTSPGFPYSVCIDGGIAGTTEEAILLAVEKFIQYLREPVLNVSRGKVNKSDSRSRDVIREGTTVKGGVNSKPLGPRPPSPKGQGFSKKSTREVSEVLKCFTPDQRSWFDLYFMERKSIGEIANMFGHKHFVVSYSLNQMARKMGLRS